MKKKIIIGIIICVLIILAVLGFLLIGHADDKKEDKKEEANAFVFQYQKQAYPLGNPFSTEQYGDPNEFSEIESCAFQGLDKTYTYDHFEIATYPDGDTDRIYTIYFLDEEVTTTEGIKISDTLDQVTEVYGKDYQNVGMRYTYQKGNTELNFIIENNIVTSIEYRLNV